MILINFSPKALMEKEKTKGIVTIHPVIFLVCFLCLMGLCISGTYFIVHGEYQSQLTNKDEEILIGQKNNKALADQNTELRNSLQRFQNEYSNLEPRYEDLASRLNAAEQRNMQTASELTTASKDLEAAKADVLKLRDELDAKLSEIETLNADRQALEQKYNDFREMLAHHLVLEPTWVGPGETTQAFDGNLLIVLYEPSDKDWCHKDSMAVSYLISGKEKKKLCLRIGRPENFTYQGKKYQFVLLKSEGNEGAVRYCIYIMR